MLGRYSGVELLLELFEDHLTLTPLGPLGRDHPRARAVFYTSIRGIQLEPRGNMFRGSLRFAVTAAEGPSLFRGSVEDPVFVFFDLGLSANADSANATMGRVKAF